ncbi:MAG: putative signal-transduction protein containing cAMP-binding and domain [Acidobacteria bacterium]|jgi:CBS domain-containing protein|nr:putative signal-transduction protein containing cAMP-binding and domain [Acidobacteriota bacterium]
MKNVHQLLGVKGADIWAIEPDATVYQALTLLAEKNIGALPVVQEQKLVGIFSERDYARKVILKGRHSKETRIREIMTGAPICVTPQKTVEECMSLMTDNHVRHLPVVEGDRLLGIISIGDVVKEIMEDQQGTISHLENFITGRR